MPTQRLSARAKASRVPAKSRWLSIRLPADLADQLANLSDRRALSMSWLAREAIQSYLRRSDLDDPIR